MDWVMLADDVRLLLRAKHGGILEGGDERLAELDLGAECPNSSWEMGGAGSHATLRRIATIAAQTYRQSTGRRRDPGGCGGFWKPSGRRR